MTTTAPVLRSRSTHRGWPARLGVDSVYLLTGLPIAVVSFTVLVTGLSLGAGLLITLVGIPVLIVTLYAAGWFAALERARLGWLDGDPVRSPGYRRRGDGLRGWWTVMSDPQRWLDTAHGLVLLPVTVVTWTIAVTWWALAAYGLTWPAYGFTIDSGDGDFLQHLGVNSYAGRSFCYVGLGVIAALTLPFVLRGVAALQAAMGKAMLANSSVAALQAKVAALTASRTAAAAAETASLRRIERDLHDGPQQRLVRIAMDLGAAQRRMENAPDTVRPLLDGALDQTREAIAELRALSRGIAPPVLADRGLAAALTDVASRAVVHVHLDVRLPDRERLPSAVENAAYFIVAEALTNVAKHAAATTARVTALREGNDLVVTVEDDGVGGADVAKGHGLAGLVDRAGGLDGTLTVDSPVGGPTRVIGRIPCG